MYKEPIFLQPAFQERIWGGKKLKTEYNYEIPYNKTGEAWVISAHSNGSSIIQNGPLSGESLAYAWKYYGELFNKNKSNNKEEYPLLVKMLDANDDLSVQVHPDDQFAQEVEGIPYGKTECWYVLHAEEEAELVLGHHAESREEMEIMINTGEWEKFLRRVKVKEGDFFYVPSGTIHAIGKGIMILETQQSSDVTYRVYDYDRKDVKGNTRELHLERAKQVITVPHQEPQLNQHTSVVDGLKKNRLVNEEYFSVYHWQLEGEAYLNLENDFMQISVVKGKASLRVEGKIFSIVKGNHFVLPHTINEYELSGHAEFIVSYV